MPSTVYVLGTLTTLLCSILLLRGYTRTRRRLLLWSGLCFAGLTVSNALVFVDLVLLAGVIDLYLVRLAAASVAVLLLLFGLIWESD